ncbi:MAG TPA: cytochrome c-type biogenesis protein [Anaerolineales bacterium]|nr:cytochrome c-type biogenesis protein [Anaerolineales bacterium]
MLKLKGFLAALTILVSLLGAAAVQAQEGGDPYPTDNDVNRVAKNLYCPVCPNTPLDVCETKACQDWRAQIKDQLAAGWSEEQVVDYFVAQYGERVLAEPQRKGFTSLVWLLPAIAVALGLVVVWQVVAGWRAARAIEPSSQAEEIDLPSETIGSIEEELRHLR